MLTIPALPTSIFPIWAEESAQINANRGEWSFGNGRETGPNGGVTFPFATRLIGLSLTYETLGTVTVEAQRNGSSIGASVTVTEGRSGYVSFDTPLNFSAGDRLRFVTLGSTGPSYGVICAWFDTQGVA